jgi:hypothetical protein
MINNWKKEVYYKWNIKDINDKEFEEEAILNFFLIDKKNNNFDYLLEIINFPKDREPVWIDLPSFKNYKDFHKYVENIANYHNNVYIEIVDDELANEDGYGRFWCYVNDKTYDIEYENDWNIYNDYTKTKW